MNKVFLGQRTFKGKTYRFYWSNEYDEVRCESDDDFLARLSETIKFDENRKAFTGVFMHVVKDYCRMPRWILQKIERQLKHYNYTAQTGLKAPMVIDERVKYV